MKALELVGKIDSEGYIKLDKPLEIKNTIVKLILLVPEDNLIDDMIWLRAISSNPAFDFLKDDDI